MKKFLTIAAMSVAMLTATAQKSVQGSRFFDNWSVGLVGGGITKTTHSAFWKNMRATYGVELTKQITPVFALRATLYSISLTSASSARLTSQISSSVTMASPVCSR